MYKKLFQLLLVLLLSPLAFATSAGDACTGSGSTTVSGSTTLVCNGSTWQLVYQVENSGQINLGYSLKLPTSGVCNSSNEGTLNWNASEQKPEYCDGTEWLVVDAATPSGTAKALWGSAKGPHSCALLSNGSVKCWGRNDYGQMGNGTTSTNQLTPVSVSGLSGVSAIALGNLHTCALLAGGTVQCWGANPSGQLGNNSTTDSSTPVTVSGLTGVSQVATGGAHSCAVINDGTVQCWGSNYYGQLGNGLTTDSPVPVTVTGLSGVTALALGYQHSCALLSDGTARCWGDNQRSQMGDTTTTTPRTTAVTVASVSNIASIAAGAYHTCALLTNGAVQCWGYNLYSQLGDGTTTDRSTAVTVSSLSNAVELGAGNGHSCARLVDGTAKCWGHNANGQTGNGNTTTPQTAPTTVLDVNNIVGLGIGGGNSCILISTGAIKCWGQNLSGQVGDGTVTSPRLTPATVVP